MQARQVANASQQSSAPPVTAAQPAAGLAASPFAQPLAAAPPLAPQANAARLAVPAAEEALQSSGSLEEVWREIMANHRSTLDFAT